MGFICQGGSSESGIIIWLYLFFSSLFSCLKGSVVTDKEVLPQHQQERNEDRRFTENKMEGKEKGERSMHQGAHTNRQHGSRNCGWAWLTQRQFSLCRHRVDLFISRTPLCVGIDWLLQRYKIHFILNRNFNLIQKRLKKITEDHSHSS